MALPTRCVTLPEVMNLIRTVRWEALLELFLLFLSLSLADPTQVIS